MKIPFNKPHITHKEMGYISHAHSMMQLSGDGYYTKKCHEWIEKYTKTKKALLTHSCTAALEMMIMLADIKPGDEVITPSFAFSSSANAIALRGGVPIFVDIREDTFNIDEKLVEQAITRKTKAILPIHYAGVAAEMTALKRIAKKHKLLVLEDAAQGVLSTYKGKLLGTIGDMGAYSFHETKNVISGEGGCLLINDKKYIERAEIIREKGTNRSKFFRGQVDKYTWVDVGSSYLPGEIIAAFLMAQLEDVKAITKRRLKIWKMYHSLLSDLEKKGFLRRPIIPKHTEHNGHLYYIIVDNNKEREKLIDHLKKNDIMTVFHYIPLHSSPAGKRVARSIGHMKVTDKVSETLIRLPLFHDITEAEVELVTKTIKNYFRGTNS